MKHRTKKRAQHKIMRLPSNNKSYPGYCHNRKHPGYITMEILDEHNCVCNNCHYLEQLDHPLWTDEKYTTQKISYKHLNRIKQAIKENEINNCQDVITDENDNKMLLSAHLI